MGVTLSEAPQRPLTIPITVTNQGDASAADHAARATYNLAFGRTVVSTSIIFSIREDTFVERGEGVKLAIGSDLPPGVSTGANSETTVNIIDDDPAVTVSFGAATYSADEDDSVDVTVTLSAGPPAVGDHTDNHHQSRAAPPQPTTPFPPA